MTDKELQLYAEKLNSDEGKLYVEEAFKMLLDNKIDRNDLVKLLALDKSINGGYILPEEFFSLPKMEQKRYFIPKRITIRVDDNGLYEEERIIFCPPYFQYMAEKAKRNQHIAKDLFKYIKDMHDSINGRLILCLRAVAFEYIFPTRKNLLSYGKDKQYHKQGKLISFYDYASNLITKWSKNAIYLEGQSKPTSTAQLFEDFKEALKPAKGNDNCLYVDFDDPCLQFAFLIESILDQLTKKQANTLRIHFCILANTDIPKSEYYEEPNKQDKVLKYAKNYLSGTKKVKDYFCAHREALRQAQLGYLSFFYNMFDDGTLDPPEEK